MKVTTLTGTGTLRARGTISLVKSFPESERIPCDPAVSSRARPGLSLRSAWFKLKIYMV